MSNIEISLRNDCTQGSGNDYTISFATEDGSVYLTSTDKKDDTQHDYELSKSEYLVLRAFMDGCFGISK